MGEWVGWLGWVGMGRDGVDEGGWWVCGVSFLPKAGRHFLACETSRLDKRLLLRLFARLTILAKFFSPEGEYCFATSSRKTKAKETHRQSFLLLAPYGRNLICIRKLLFTAAVENNGLLRNV